jgi:hypothetical protein
MLNQHRGAGKTGPKRAENNKKNSKKTAEKNDESG